MKLTGKIFLMLFISILISQLAIGILSFMIYGDNVYALQDLRRGPSLLVFFGNIGCVLLFSFLVNQFIIRRIKSITKATKEVALGKYDVILPVESNDELAILSTNFNTMVKELKANEYLNKEYSKNVSHEIRTPLSSIIGYATLLTSDSKEAKTIEYSERINEEAKKLLNMSKQMLTFSKLESSNIIKKEDQINLSKQIRDVIISMQQSWEDKKLSFDLDLAEIEIKSNKELTRLIFSNLISNAIKYAPEEDSIIITLTRNDTSVIFTITNHGEGIPVEKQKHLFFPFSSGSDNLSGASYGIGLSLVKKITEKLDGEVTFESIPNEKTTFVVKLNC